MVKGRRITLKEIKQALDSDQQIPLRLLPVELTSALRLAAERNLYAYDAYVISCAKSQRCELLTLDTALARTAIEAGVKLLKLEP